MGRLNLLMTVAVLFFPLGCGGESGRELAVPHHERFVGQWLVHEVEPHALYSASLFRFERAGALQQTWDAGFYPEGTHGYVRSPDSSVTCAFGSNWHSRGAQTLIIAGACTDGSARDITLAFPSDVSLDTEDAAVQIVSVGGETNWLVPRWGWAFRKCDHDPSTPAECGAGFPAPIRGAG